jgi:hypothetical protein
MEVLNNPRSARKQVNGWSNRGYWDMDKVEKKDCGANTEVIY